MTTPTGHPDYQAYAQWRGLNLFPDTVLNQAPGSVTFGPFTMTHWSALWLRMLITAGQAQVSLHWWADAAATIGLGADTFFVNATTSLLTSMPVQGPYLTVVVNNTGGINLVGTRWMTGSNNNPGRPIFPITTDEASAINIAVTSGTPVNRRPGFIMGGLGYLMVNPRDATGHLTFVLQQLDETNTVQAILWQAVGITALVTLNFVAPAIPIQLQVTNNDGAAQHNFDCFLIVTAST